ncbi:hypothetical protein GCM10010503_41450 [Streptomyces lucensis JCM 4490]|uniref:Uncharacterized protein n=1 Tax=Streptomyces lucensis JCM 4490 TaxID=1306176 RepID=A0A918MSG0_9ACTN|nr:hypothetical protein GCM10010503_41450 [Streptomyces lucensis JCM 4490]
MRAANIRVYASTTHCRAVIRPLRDFPIAGRAMLTADTSIVITVKPSSDATSATPPRRGTVKASPGGAAGSGRCGRRRHGAGAEDRSPCPWAGALDADVGRTGVDRTGNSSVELRN